MDSKPTVIVYRDELLGVSETFIRAQAESLTRFTPYFVGLRPGPGLSLPEDRTHLVTNLTPVERLQCARFKYFGPNSSLVRRLESLHPRLIHAHFGPDASNALALADALRIPTVVSLHGHDIAWSDAYHSQLYLRRRSQLQDKAACFLCVSNFIREHALAKGFPATRTLVHYTGIDTKFFQPKVDVSRLPVVLFVGRLVPEKGCGHLIQAMQLVQEKLPEAKLIIIGNGPLRRDLEHEAAVRLTQYEFLGPKSVEIVRDWMNWARVFCAPSTTEGFGTVFTEAQAMGLPVVGFETGGVPEAVANGETGFLVPNGDIRQLADRLIQVLLDPNLRARMGRAGQFRVATRFDINKQTLALEEIYEHVITEWELSKSAAPATVQNELFPCAEIPPSIRSPIPTRQPASRLSE